RGSQETVEELMSRLDMIWREWLFQGLDSRDAIARYIAVDGDIIDRLRLSDDMDRDRIVLARARIGQYNNAMLVSIESLRRSQLNESNGFVRCREFYRHVPASGLVRDSKTGILTVPTLENIEPQM
ncbi:MAG: hypothetical protein ACK5Q5_24275, partial [Planctomycetaceae bacterium]